MQHLSTRMPSPPLLQVVSGGQNGVDRAALEVALALGIPCGGWCPRGRRAEDGAIALRYPLQETPSPDYAQRTRWNVRDSDATLILYRDRLRGGTALTARIGAELRRPWLEIALTQPWDPSAVRDWLESEAVAILNVAGPRESQAPGIYAEAAAWLRAMFEAG